MASTTETLNIVIREDGSRVVVRNIGDIRGASKDATSSIEVMQKALGGLVAYLAVDKIIQYADAWANAAGLIAIATKSSQEAVEVTDALFAATQRTRIGFADVVNVYAAVERAASTLGASQADAIKFTEGLGEALAVQHVGAQQARGALIQLGQLLDSGNVRAQEFNSIMLETPVVLQTVAKGMGDATGSVGRLRAQMLAGKLTSKDFFDAFLKGAPSLNADFQKSAHTFAQGFQVITNGVQQFIGQLNESSKASNEFGKAAQLIAANLQQIADAFIKLAETLAAIIAAFVTFKTAVEAVRITALVVEFVAYTVAVANGTVVTLGSAEAERQRAAAILATVAAQQTAIATQQAANVATAEAAVKSTASHVADVAATQAAIVASREENIAKLAKANADIAGTKAARDSIAVTRAASLAAHENASLAGAQSFAIKVLREAEASLVALRVEEAAADATLTAAEQARIASLAELAILGKQQVSISAEAAAAATANAAAQTALSEAQGAAATTNAAAAVATAAAAKAATTAAKAAAGTTSLFAQALTYIGSAATAVFSPVAKLFVLINTNPFVAIATAIVATIGFLLVWGNDITATGDKITTLNDLVRSFGSETIDLFKSLGTSLADTFSPLTDIVKAAFENMGFLITEVFGGVGSSILTVLTSVGTTIAAKTTDYLDSFTGFFSGVDAGFAGFLEGFARVIDAMAGLLTGLGLAVVRVFTGIPAIIAASFKSNLNVLSDILTEQANAVIDVINKVRQAVGQSLIDKIQAPKFDVDTSAYKKYGENISKSFDEGFDIQNGFAEKFVDGVVIKAQALAKSRDLNNFLTTTFDTIGKGRVDLDKKPPPPPDVGPNEKDIKKTTEALRVLENSIDSVGGAQLDLSKGIETLIHARQLNLISDSAESTLLVQLTEHYRDQLDPLGKINREIDEQNQLLGMTAEAREVESKVLEDQKSLRKDGKNLSDIEIQQLRDKLTAQQQLNEAVVQQDQLLSQSVGARKTFDQQTTAIKKLAADPTTGFTTGDKDQAVNQAASQAGIDLSGTQTAINAQLDQFKNMYAQIDKLRAKDLITEETAQTARARIGIQAYALQTKNVEGFFSDVASLSSSGNRKLFEIGKAAAIANAAIAGAQAVMNAYATPPWYVGLALAIGAAVKVAAQIATIEGTQFNGGGFMEGGFTGGNSVSDVMGAVHGKEYVIDAANTARLGVENLDALRSGDVKLVSASSRSVGSAKANSSGNPPKVTILNYGTSKTFETQISGDDVRVIARDEAQQQILKNTPKLVASQMSDPNSPISKSLTKNTTTARKR